ncbi:MAG TPA: PTS sugar transporter subunit IIA [Candidatus Fournierella merdigallinarum]|nr:PTS sugar transporter subunit IIA [Candidatus Fournierella merdigallinarum]
MKILIATHGRFASGIKSSVELLTGKGDKICCIDAYVEQDGKTVGDADIPAEMERFFAQTAPEEETVVFTDLKGGSVNSRVMELIPPGRKVFLVSGFNLPMVLEVVMAEEDEPITGQTLQSALEMCRESMVLVPPLWERENAGSEEESFFA